MPGFVSSDVFEIFQLQMRRLGYKELTDVYDARDYGGLTSRKRAYSMFSCLPNALEAPAKSSAGKKAGEIGLKHLEGMRDITENVSIQKGLECGRLRSFNAESAHCPTFLKSQSRMAKDTVTFENEGRQFFPTNELMAELMGIEASFEAVSKTIESEQIGQSVEIPLSRSIMNCIKNHLDVFFEGASKHSKKATALVSKKAELEEERGGTLSAGQNYQLLF